jgi:hypothetical protein
VPEVPYADIYSHVDAVNVAKPDAQPLAIGEPDSYADRRGR